MRIGFWGPLYFQFSKEPPQNSIGNYLSPYLLEVPDRSGEQPMLKLGEPVTLNMFSRASGRWLHRDSQVEVCAASRIPGQPPQKGSDQ